MKLHHKQAMNVAFIVYIAGILHFMSTLLSYLVLFSFLRFLFFVTELVKRNKELMDQRTNSTSVLLNVSC